MNTFSHVATAAMIPLAASPLCRAQIVSPPHFANAEAPLAGSGPFGQDSSTGWRLVQVHDDFAGPARTIRGLAMRRDAAALYPHNSYSVRMTLLVSNAATTSAAMDATFDNNHGANRVTVVSDRLTTFPSTTVGGAPAPFAYVVPFDVPFQYDGVGSLCWEVRVTSSSNMLTSYALDYAGPAMASPALEVSPYGFGCRYSSRLYPMSAAGSSSMDWPSGAGTLWLDGLEMPDASLVAAALGFSNTSFRGIPLPFLMPGSLTAPSGPCVLLSSAEVSFGVATSNGAARLSVPVPAAPPLHGLHVYGQYLTYDPGAGHPLGVVGSNGVEFCWVAPFGDSPISQVEAANVFATTGAVYSNFGYVVQLR